RISSRPTSAGKARLYGASVQDPGTDVCADGGSVFETVAGAATNQPYIVEIRMTVDEEIGVGRVLVLADAKFRQCGIAQRRKAFGHEGLRFRRAFGSDAAVA